MRKHLALLDGKHFKEEIPAKTWSEALKRKEQILQDKMTKYNAKLVKIGEEIEQNLQNSQFMKKLQLLGARVEANYEKLVNQKGKDKKI